MTPHFTEAELTTTSTGLDNTPPPDIRKRLLLLATCMEQVRHALGGHPIHVTSGYRSPEVNARVGGSPTSDHMSGWACDFAHPLLTPYEVCETLIVSGLVWHQLINEQEKGVTHISFQLDDLKREVLTQQGRRYVRGNQRHGGGNSIA